MGLRVYGRKITSVWALLAGSGTALKFTHPTAASWLGLHRLQQRDLNQERSCARQAVGVRREPGPCPS